ncbi:MAG: hypothetical protein HWE26_13660 [Alteromonadaceae bacterium]|nr:hypothetical protein [Alteromonadaceae bacterium]
MGKLTRRADWPVRLSTYLRGVGPYEIGVTDCALFVAGAIEAITGADLAARYRGRYRRKLDGLRILRADGFADPRSYFAAHLPATDRPQAGDVAILKNSLAIVQGSRAVYVAGSSGVGVVPIGEAVAFLRV